MAEVVLRNPVTVLPVPEGATCAQRVGYLARNICGRPAKTMAYTYPRNQEPSPVCGIHRAALVRRYRYDLERRERDEARKIRDAQVRTNMAYADNLAQFLTDQLGVTLRAANQGTDLRISITDARAIYQAKVILCTADDRRTTWRLTDG